MDENYLEAYYHFDLDSSDAYNYSFHGTDNIMGYMTGSNLSASAYFNGTNSYISLPIDLTGSSVGSVSFWFNSTATDGYFFSYGSSGSQNYFLNLRLQSGKLRIQQKNNDIQSDFDSTSTYNDGGFHHVVLTSDSSLWRLYIDNVSETLVSAGSGPNNGDWFTDTNANMLNLGVLGRTTFTNYYDGQLDEFSFWNKTLNTTEISELYDHGINQTTPSFVSPEIPSTLTNITAYYDFEEFSAPYVSLQNNSVMQLTNTTSNDGQNINGIINNGILFENPTKLVSASTYAQPYNFSVNFWMKMNAPNTTQTLIYHQGVTLNRNVWNLGFNNTDLLFNLQPNSLTATPFNFSTNTIFDNNWHLITLVVNLTSPSNYAVSLFIDSEYFAETTISGIGNPSPSNYVYETGIGTAQDGSKAFNGSIDELSLWSTELKQNDITYLYNNGMARNLYGKNITINLRNGITNTDLSLYSATITRTNPTVTDTKNIIDNNVTFNNIPRGVYNFSVTINNNSNYVPSKYLNYNVTSTTAFYLYLYDLILGHFNFSDALTLNLITDQVDIEFIGNNAYTNSSSNGSVYTYLPFDTYEINAQDNAQLYSETQYFDQDLLISQTISGVLPTFNLSMYLFNQTGIGVNNITATVRDQIANIVEGAVIHVQQYDITTNSYLTVQVVKTNLEGEARFQGNLNSDKYKFLIFYKGVQVYSSQSTRLYSDTLNFFINTKATPGTAYFLVDEFSHSLSHNPITNIASLTYTGLDGLNNRVCLKVTKTSGTGFITNLNESCSSAVSGTINIYVVNQTEKSHVKVRAYLYTETGSEEKNSINGLDLFFGGNIVSGNLGLFLTFILILLGIGMGWWNPGIIPVSTTSMFMIAGFIGLHALPLALTGTFLVLGIGLTIWLSDKT